MATELVCGCCGRVLDSSKNGNGKVKVICQECNRALNEELEPKGFAPQPKAVLDRWMGIEAFQKKAG